MPTVTGTLTDINMGHLVGKSPQLVFTLNAPNSGGNLLHPTEPVRVTPASDGTFSVTLAATTEMNDDTAFYLLSVQWLNSVGNSPIRADHGGWKIQVPTTGGALSGLWVQKPGNQRMVYVSLTAPENPAPWTLWLEANPLDDDDPANTWDLNEWSNV